ncbi:MAG: flagellar biosynthetic protein FliR [Desulfobacterota bacterium]|nr:flagellar biosynthetic protein FliR [Thermodesulfobacteriota bacterium]
MTPTLLNWTLQQFQSFAIVLIRVASILFLMPLLGTRYVPVLVKVGLALVISLILLPLVAVEVQGRLFEPAGFVFYLIAELMIGLCLGLAVKLIFAGIQLAGEFLGYQMGLAMASLIDPQSGLNTTVVAEFNYLAGLLLFLALDGHHWFFKALVESFREIVPGGWQMKTGLYHYLLQLSGKMFVVAVKLAAPVTAIILFTQIALGLTAKMVPQINLLMASFPLTIGLGLLFWLLSLDLFAPYLQSLFDQTGREMVYTVLPLIGR